MSLHRITPTARLLARTFQQQGGVARPSTLASASASSALRTTLQVRQAGTAVSSKAPTTKMSPQENLNLLNEQRSVRPSSPHFTIYQPQLTWLASIANRVTGVGLSVGLYGYALAYAILPYVGYADYVSSTFLMQLVATVPFWIKIALKAPISAAFSFHTFNGIRHLAWDKGYFMSIKGCYNSGYAVLGATALATVGLCLV